MLQFIVFTIILFAVTAYGIEFQDFKRITVEEGKTGEISLTKPKNSIADVNGLETFLPGSQIDIRPILDYDAYVGNVSPPTTISTLANGTQIVSVAGYEIIIKPQIFDYEGYIIEKGGQIVGDKYKPDDDKEVPKDKTDPKKPPVDGDEKEQTKEDGNTSVNLMTKPAAVGVVCFAIIAMIIFQ